MTCPTIITGDSFVTRVLTHIDCQSRYLGSYGYEALGQPGSPAAIAMTGLLTLFVALWGIRLLFGPAPHGRDVVYDVLKIGIVVTLAFSWPAFRTLVHDVTLDAPAEIAASLANPGLASSASGFVERLQGVDNGILALTELGTGRWTGNFLEGQAGGATYAGTSLQDDAAFGWSRLIYIGGMFGSLALLRIVAGLLLALAPLAAGMLLFEATRGLFAGWLRGLVLTLLGSVGVTVILSVELAVLEPWLADALRVRQLGYATAAAPIELFAITAAFAIVQFATIWLMARIAFMRGWPVMPALRLPEARSVLARGEGFSRSEPAVAGTNRVQRLADQVEMQVRREQMQYSRVLAGSGASASRGADASASDMVYRQERLGSSYRRSAHDRSRSGHRRDAGE